MSQSNRTVVFDVGGVINISSRIVVSGSVTIAGQTAPGGGITIYGDGVACNAGNNNIRYIRIRMGKNGTSEKDALIIASGQNFIFDHVPIYWERDGTLDGQPFLKTPYMLQSSLCSFTVPDPCNKKYHFYSSL